MHFYLSGGASNADAALAIGGARSSVEMSQRVFGAVPAASFASGGVFYRCVYVRAVGEGKTAVKVHVTDTPSANTTLAIGWGAAAKNVPETPTANVTTAPQGVTFATPATAAVAASGGDLGIGDSRALWLRYTVTAGSFIALESSALVVSGVPNVELGAIVADLTGTLSVVTAVATGQTLNHGVAAVTLSTVTPVATGTLGASAGRTGAVTATLDAATCVGTGTRATVVDAISDFRSMASTSDASRTNTTIAVPVGTVTGDKLLMIHGMYALGASVPTVTAPAGWTEFTSSNRTRTGSGYFLSSRIYWKNASSEPSTYTLTHAACFTYCHMMAVTVPDPAATPIFSVATGTGATIAASTVTTVATNSLAVFISEGFREQAPATPPTGYTAQNTGSGFSTFIASMKRPTAGATGTVSHTSTTGTGEPWIAYLIAVKPDPAGIVLAPLSGTLTKTLGAARSAAPVSVPFTMPTVVGTRYMSPTGSDAANGLTEGTAKKTFAGAMAVMSANYELVLLDGNYTLAQNGDMYWDGTGASNVIPNGTSLAAPTLIRAKNPGSARCEGQIFVGRSFRRDQYIYFYGLNFEHGAIYNGQNCTFKACGFAGTLSIGTNDHTSYCTYNLVEDCWAWAKQARINVQNYQSDYNVWRRVVIRGDGCDEDYCMGSGNPMVGFTVYDCQFNHIQNMILVDWITGGGQPYADFSTAQHTPTPTSRHLGNNVWRGCMSINSEQQAVNHEADEAVSPTYNYKDFLEWGGWGFNQGGQNFGSTYRNITIHCGVITGTDAVRFAPNNGGNMTGGTLSDFVSVCTSGRSALNSSFVINNVATAGTYSQGTYDQTTPTGTVITTDPFTSGAIKWPVKIETGSALKGTGTSGADIGANIMFRWGVDGTRYGETDFDVLTEVPLWPWPYQDRIKSDFSIATPIGASATRGFCSTGTRLNGIGEVTLSSYIWELNGWAVPDEYGG